MVEICPTQHKHRKKMLVFSETILPLLLIRPTFTDRMRLIIPLLQLQRGGSFKVFPMGP